jgi:hypothetical protein
MLSLFIQKFSIVSFKKAVIKFTNEETDAKFEALTTIDQFVDVPARKGAGQCYRGMISNLNPQAAERMVRFGTNLIRRKATVALYDPSLAGISGTTTNEQTS